MEDAMKILFLGGDTRYKYMMKDLCNKHQIFQIGFSDLEDNINKEKLENINLAKYDDRVGKGGRDFFHFLVSL